MEQNLIWTDKKRTLFGLPLSFTRYKLLEDKLLIESGLLNTVQEEIRLYRIVDITLKRSLFERIFKVGTICCNSVDKSTPVFYIDSVKNPVEVKELLSKKVEEVRNNKKISVKEVMVDDIQDYM